MKGKVISMKILYMGTPHFAATILHKLIESNHEIIGVVTQPDKQKGRGKAISFSAVKETFKVNSVVFYAALYSFFNRGNGF